MTECGERTGGHRSRSVRGGASSFLPYTLYPLFFRDVCSRFRSTGACAARSFLSVLITNRFDRVALLQPDVLARLLRSFLAVSLKNIIVLVRVRIYRGRFFALLVFLFSFLFSFFFFFLSAEFVIPRGTAAAWKSHLIALNRVLSRVASHSEVSLWYLI